MREKEREREEEEKEEKKSVNAMADLGWKAFDENGDQQIEEYVIAKGH